MPMANQKAYRPTYKKEGAPWGSLLSIVTERLLCPLVLLILTLILKSYLPQGFAPQHPYV